MILNGSERVPVSGVDVDGSKVTIRFDWYDSAIRATLSGDGNAMTGEWTRTVPSGTARLPFRATRGEQPRFSPAPKAAASLGDVSGIWKAEFVDSDGDVSGARGVPPGSQRRVTGTFLTPTGDHRYLEGSYENGLLRLSTFDGAHAFLFQARATSRRQARRRLLAARLVPRDMDAPRAPTTRAPRCPTAGRTSALTNAEGRFSFRFPDLDGDRSR